MKLTRLLLASLALFPASAFVTVQPAQAQASCKWNLDGEWVGQRSGNRVLMEMRPGGFVTWISGQAKPGQNEANNVFREAGPKAWTFTFPDGTKTTARLEPSNMLRITNPDGWTDLFKRVSPATTPRCVPTAAAAPAATAAPARSLNAPARKPATATAAGAPFDPNRIVTKVHQADLVAIVRKNNGTIVSEHQHGEVSVLAKTPDGLFYLLIGRVCNLPDYGPGCLGLEFQVRYDADSRVTFDNINTANQTFSAAKVYRGQNDEGGDTVFVSHYTILDGGQKMGNLSDVLVNIIAIAPQVSNIIWP